MKKLLLLALTVTAAASLTACGGSNKEIDEMLELINPTTEGVEANYSASIAYGTERHFNVNGNNYNYCGYGSTMYDADSNSNDYYSFSVDTEGAVSVARYTYPTDTTADTLTLEQSQSSVYDYVGYLYQGAFAYVQNTLNLDDEITSGDFKYDKESETYYFVNPTFDKAVQDAITVTTSGFTIKLTYNDDKELVSAVIDANGLDFTYNFKEVSFTMPGATTEGGSTEEDGSTDGDNTTGA